MPSFHFLCFFCLICYFFLSSFLLSVFSGLPLSFLLRHFLYPSRGTATTGVIVPSQDVAAGKVLLRFHVTAAVCVFIRGSFDDVAKERDNNTLLNGILWNAASLFNLRYTKECFLFFILAGTVISQGLLSLRTISIHNIYSSSCWAFFICSHLVQWLLIWNTVLTWKKKTKSTTLLLN